MNKILLSLLVVSLSSCKPQEIETYLSQLYEAGKLNGNVLVAKNDEVIYERSFGYADPAKNRLLTNEHRFNIGSIYKEFPAVCILQLKERGMLSLDDRLREFFPGLPAWAEEISVTHLLRYSSGLPRISWNTYFGQGINVTEEHIMADLEGIETLEFAPGSGYLYTNYSPILLIKIVEKVSGKTFNEYLKENIFTPYQITSLVLKEQFPYQDTTLMAIPFNEEFQPDGYKIKVPYLLLSATTRDMYQWLKELHAFKILTKESVQFLSQDAGTGDDLQSPLGHCQWENEQVIEHSHHGSSGSYECLVTYWPQEELKIIILTNQKHRNLREISGRIKEMTNRL